MLILLHPAKDQVTVQVEGELSDDARYRLIDLTGKVILNGAIQSTVTTIQLNQIASGQYLLNVVNIGQSSVQKLSVK